MMPWLIALGVLALLAILPIGVCLIYNASGLIISFLFGSIKIRLFPKTSKKESKSKENIPEQKKNIKTSSKPKERSGGKLTDFLPLLKIALRFLDSFRRKLCMKRLEMKLTMAGGDPCDLAVNYGRAWAVAGNIVPLLERAFVIKKRDIQVQCDFTDTDTKIYARLDITITLGRILGIAGKYGVLALIEFVKIKRKGGMEI